MRTPRSVADSRPNPNANAPVGKRPLGVGVSARETFHLDWTPIELDDVVSGEDTRTVLLRDGRAYVRWSASGALRLLGDYIDELISLR